MGPFRLAALGIAAYLAILVATIPASFLAARVLEASRGSVELTEPTGCAWSGAARAQFALPGSKPVTIDQIDWRLVPGRLLAGELAFELAVRSQAITATFEAGRGFSGFRLRNLAATGDASGIAAMVPALSTWQPGGAMSASSSQLGWDRRALAGDLAIEWRGATLSLSEVRPLGTYKAEIRAEGEPARFTVRSLAGPLRIQGEGTVTGAAGVAFTGEARAEAAQAAALEPLLALLGTKRPDGAHALAWRLP